MTELVAVYGTLRHGGRLHHQLGIEAGRARPAGRARIEGALYEVVPEHRDAGSSMSYPCYYEGGDGRVEVELYEVLDPSLWPDLDELEGFLPHDLERSEYHRRLVRLLDVRGTDAAPRPDTEAWTYVYVRTPPEPTRRIAGGDWIAAAR